MPDQVFHGLGQPIIWDIKTTNYQEPRPTQKPKGWLCVPELYQASLLDWEQTSPFTEDLDHILVAIVEGRYLLICPCQTHVSRMIQVNNASMSTRGILLITLHTIRPRLTTVVSFKTDLALAWGAL